MRKIGSGLAAIWMVAATGLPAALAQGADLCDSGQVPQFSSGFAALKAEVGDAMGDAIECEHTNPDNGDTLQRTTTGLAFYRRATTTPTFTDGNEHWALTSDGLVYWTGGSIDLPWVVSPAPTPTPAAPAIIPEAEIAVRAGPSVVQVVAGTTAGSGVSVPDGVLTNEHVVSGFERVDLFTNEGQRLGATVRSTDPTRDLALLLPDLVLPTLEMESTSQQRQGDPLLVLGYPRPTALGIGGGQASLTRGLLSAIRRENGVTLIQTDATVNPGNSGGPMLNMRGKVVGVMSFGLKDSAGLNFAIGVDSIRAFLAAPQMIARPATARTSPSVSPVPTQDVEPLVRDLCAILPDATEIGPDFWDPHPGCKSDYSTISRFGQPVARYERQFLNGPPDTIRNVDVELHRTANTARVEFERLAAEYFARPIVSYRAGVACVKDLYVCRKFNVIVWVYLKDWRDPRILDIVLRKIDAVAH